MKIYGLKHSFDGPFVSFFLQRQNLLPHIRFFFFAVVILKSFNETIKNRALKRLHSAVKRELRKCNVENSTTKIDFNSRLGFSNALFLPFRGALDAAVMFYFQGCRAAFSFHVNGAHFADYIDFFTVQFSRCIFLCYAKSFTRPREADRRGVRDWARVVVVEEKEV